MNKRGQLDMDINWGAFLVLASIGIGAFAVHLIILNKMTEFDYPMWVKIVTPIVCLGVAYFFTKLWFE